MVKVYSEIRHKMVKVAFWLDTRKTVKVPEPPETLPPPYALWGAGCPGRGRRRAAPGPRDPRQRAGPSTEVGRVDGRAARGAGAAGPRPPPGSPCVHMSIQVAGAGPRPPRPARSTRGRRRRRGAQPRAGVTLTASGSAAWSAVISGGSVGRGRAWPCPWVS